MSVLEEIKRKSGCHFQPANAADLQKLRALAAPEEVWAFFSISEPGGIVEVNKARLWPISELIVENSEMVPGCYAQPRGYLVFATTIYGDAFCLDTKTNAFPASAPVVLVAHDLQPQKGTSSREELAPLAKAIAASFAEFLEKFVAEALDIEPLYPQRNG